MTRLRLALGSALAGNGTVAIISGEPGVGKTRLLQELAAHAAQNNVRLLEGRCFEESGVPALDPWVQVLTPLIEAQSADNFVDSNGPISSDIVNLIPALQAAAPSLEGPPDIEPSQARFRLFSAISNVLLTASRSQPLLISLEDVHLADEPSIRLLQSLAARLKQSRILLVATAREEPVSLEHPLAEVIGQLSRGDAFLLLALNRLSFDEVLHLAEEVGGPAAKEVAPTLYGYSDGNAFFLTELLDLVRRDGVEALDSLEAKVPLGLRAIVAQRMAPLSTSCRELLTIAAALGEAFEPSLLAEVVTDMTPSHLEDTLDEALRAGVLEELPGAGSAMRFTHSIVRQAVLADLSRSRRDRLHARIAESLEEAWSDSLDQHAAVLAYQFARAAGALGHSRAVRYCLAAGNAALQIHAFEEAAAHFEWIRDLAEERVVQLRKADVAAAVFGLGKAQAALVNTHEAETSLTTAFDLFLESSDAAMAVSVALYPVSQGNVGIPRLVERALDLNLAELNSTEQGELLSQRGFHRGLDLGDLASAERDFDEALKIARASADESLEMWTFARIAHVDIFSLRADECIEHSRRALLLNRRVKDTRAEVWCRNCMVAALAEITGRSQEAEQHALAMQSAAEAARYRLGLIQALANRANVLFLRGDWDGVRAAAGGEAAASARCTATLAMTAANQGAAEECAALLNRLIEGWKAGQPFFDYWTGLGLPLTSAILGRPTDSETALLAAQGRLSQSDQPLLLRIEAMMGPALVAVEQGSSSVARQYYEDFMPFSKAMTPYGVISGGRLLGLLARTFGDAQAALAHFDDGLVFCRRAGYQPEVVWLLLERAEVLGSESMAGPGEEVIAAAREALRLALDLGMKPAVDRAQAVLRLRTNSLWNDFSAGLSRREADVMQLLGGGQSNQEIADALFLSVRTVERHLTNIYRKSGLRGRSQATIYAREHGLRDSEPT